MLSFLKVKLGCSPYPIPKFAFSYIQLFFICKMGRIHAHCSHTKPPVSPDPRQLCAVITPEAQDPWESALISFQLWCHCVLEAHRVYPDDNGKEEVCILVAHVGSHFAHSNNLISVFLRFSLFFWVLFLMLAPSSLLFTHPCSRWLHPYFIPSGSPMTSMAISQPSFYSFLSIVFSTGSHSLSSSETPPPASSSLAAALCLFADSASSNWHLNLRVSQGSVQTLCFLCVYLLEDAHSSFL